jgi:hypothetical protein
VRTQVKFAILFGVIGIMIDLLIVYANYHGGGPWFSLLCPGCLVILFFGEGHSWFQIIGVVIALTANVGFYAAMGSLVGLRNENRKAKRPPPLP